jgi:hypothetical protein
VVLTTEVYAPEQLYATPIVGFSTTLIVTVRLLPRAMPPAVQVGGVVTEVPITFRERLVGRSKMTVGIAVEAAWIVLRLAFTKNPLKRFRA